MRRAVLTLGGTVAGLAALFSFKTHVPGVTPVAATSTPTGLSASAPPTPAASSRAPASASPSKKAKKTAPKASPTAPAGTAPPAAPPSEAPSSSAPPQPPTTAPAKPSGSFTGPTENTQYGPVQVQITVSNGKITDANGNLPDGGDSIGQNAIPQLNQEVLTVQSANIQAVSGATSTSEGYIGSLQQAVDQAGL
jgi:uncharacterized protein with FMN-binding domain